MTESLHDHPGGYALDEQQGGAAVPEVVEPPLGQTGSLEEALEGQRQILRVEWHTGHRREDQAAIGPFGARRQTFRDLPSPVLLETV